MAVEIRGTYAGELKVALVHGPSGTKLTTEAPLDNGGTGGSFSPTDLVATALGSCMLTTMALVANREGIDLRGSTVHVEKHMSAEGPRRIVRLPVVLRLPAKMSEVQRQKLENAGRACPVHKSLHPDISAPIVFEYVL
jgi:putative redox protein